MVVQKNCSSAQVYALEGKVSRSSWRDTVAVHVRMGLALTRGLVPENTDVGDTFWPGVQPFQQSDSAQYVKRTC